MTQQKLMFQAVHNSVGVMLYAAGIAWLLTNGDRLFGNTPSFLAPLAFLMLFVFSALITALLVFGLPAFHYLSGRKQDAFRLLGFTVVALFVETAAALALLATF